MSDQIEFFGMQTANDWFKKLEWEWRELEKAPNNIFSATNFFITADHLLDWVHEGDGAAIKAHRAEAKILQVVSHLSNRGKHRVLHDKRHTSVDKGERALGPPRQFHYVQSHGSVMVQGGRFFGPVLWVHLRDPFKSLFRDERVHVTVIAAMALNYWRYRPEFLYG